MNRRKNTPRKPQTYQHILVSPGIICVRVTPAPVGWCVEGKHAHTGFGVTWCGTLDDAHGPYIPYSPFTVADTLYMQLLQRYSETYTIDQVEALENEIILALAPLLAGA